MSIINKQECTMKSILKRLLFPVIGLSSLIWFLIRVIPKPSRAHYPCMRAAAPVATSFLIWAAGLLSSALFFKKARRYFVESRFVLFTLALFAGTVMGIVAVVQNAQKANAVIPLSVLEPPNQPMGTGVGIHPGRVVWVYNPNATDENCDNIQNDYWSQDDNTNQDTVNAMVSWGLRRLTGESTDAAAWDALFRYFNNKHGKGGVGYAAGEKIVIKINLNAVSSGPKNINTSPQVCYAVLNQLVNVVGVAQADIGIGDPNSNVDGVTWDKCHPAFPDVKYWGSGNGRTPVPPSANQVLIAGDGSFEDCLPQAYLDAAYMINLPVLKKHHRAGISLCSKNHFGSIGAYTGGAWHLHPSLPSPDATGEAVNGEYGVYRCFVDIMGHKDLGGKTLLFLIDGLWSSVNWGHPPVKWRMTPFNKDWPSSLFLSQDPVAIESVGFDFLYKEFDASHPTEGGTATDNKGPFPHFPGTDDFLHQAADSKNWPSGMTYDPEGDGTPLPSSMGVHEHWNNATGKQYVGIDLVTTSGDSGTDGGPGDGGIARGFALYANYPNPFNPRTEIRYALASAAHVHLTVYDAAGRLIRTLADGQESAGDGKKKIWDGLMNNGLPAPAGVYVYRLIARSGSQTFQQSRKMTLNK
jgi:hypothetical protein